MNKRSKPSTCRCKNGLVYTPYITIKGVRVYKQDGGVFVFPCTLCGNN